MKYVETPEREGAYREIDGKLYLLIGDDVALSEAAVACVFRQAADFLAYAAVRKLM